MLVLILLGAAVASSDELRCSLCGKVIAAREKYYQVKGGKEVYCETCYIVLEPALPVDDSDFSCAQSAVRRCVGVNPSVLVESLVLHSGAI
jgi:hypothetical protein